MTRTNDADLKEHLNRSTGFGDSSDSPKVLVLFGTRPEAIKLAPVIAALKRSPDFRSVVVSSSQHTDLLKPFLRIFDINVDHDLKVMSQDQTPNQVSAKILNLLDPILEIEKPDVILVQGDTTTAFTGAFAAFNRKIAVGHVEAGLRSGNPLSPFPEEMNRRLISQLAAFNFAATESNRENLLRESGDFDNIYVVGNTVVDALHFILESSETGEDLGKLLSKTEGMKRILLTTHRRESFGEVMGKNLSHLRKFVETHDDVCLFFPVHPNPNVREATYQKLNGSDRIFLLDPMDYADFVALMKESWLIVSDSGGVQEEAPSLGKPLLVLRENTERPEAIASGVAKLIGSNADLFEILEENYRDESWIRSVREIENPFGDGASAKRILTVLKEKIRISA
ncbi:MAG: UDP-N-acetylglucosamine 2-epimerase (non-hydrolyzing) [Pyrinomonadaceae bacterium]|nr:UDP-N-acetylglucosamine 2-epimerase (non-hydrolyzing) [Pyrinomonadaceae bacterium]